MATGPLARETAGVKQAARRNENDLQMPMQFKKIAINNSGVEFGSQLAVVACLPDATVALWRGEITVIRN